MEHLKVKLQAQNPLFTRVGLHELFSDEMWRATLTEAVATAASMFTISTLVVSCLESSQENPKLLVSFAIFLTVFLFLMTVIPISGGHLNPTFSCIAALKGLVSVTRATAYIVAQCVGSVLGFLAVKCVMSNRSIEKYALGGCIVSVNGQAPELDTTTAFTLEFMCAFVLLFVGVTVGFDRQRSKELGLITVCIVTAATIGMLVFMSITVTGSAGYAGVGLNPARCLGPALLMGGSLWHGHWVFWLGPLLACIAYYAYSIAALPAKDGDQHDAHRGQIAGDESIVSKRSNNTVSDFVETV